MIKFNTLHTIELISYFLWSLTRILSFLSTAPIFSDKLISKKNKIMLSIFISILIAPMIPEIHVTLLSSVGLLILIHQILIGTALGFITRLLFAAANMAGEIISMQIGLSFSNFYNSSNHIGNTTISRLLNIFLLFFFLTINAHLYLISVLVDSFYKIPIDIHFLHSNIFFILSKFSSFIFINGVMFVLPIIIFLLSISIIMSFLNRLSPQMSIFSIGFSLSLLIGIFMLYAMISIIFPLFQSFLNELKIFTSYFFYQFQIL
ncbi:flagellar biosynthetic protein FliR [Buchnera aphidicola (Muscaphis stroyani)]|uniref:Flagellar biosynthetic protein FliR n=1 Tax=Buchnera aphidicola (Muscaphis stroyani) TaxID=1241869 RepID=A0A4D6Y504_9GAMM|nr:flagellar biosynthetic protein FliR [Buchnera aphidicola]QCI24189.1 flagellar biosynthetic protein FliR [Buchnera aphidicola (Muscaphis stroyani)]